MKTCHILYIAAAVAAMDKLFQNHVNKIITANNNMNKHPTKYKYREAVQCNPLIWYKSFVYKVK